MMVPSIGVKLFLKTLITITKTGSVYENWEEGSDYFM